MATKDQKPDTTTRELSSQALALAEQLGRIAGTLEGTAETWLNRASVTDQLNKVRDAAASMLSSLAAGAAKVSKGAEGQSGRGKPGTGMKASTGSSNGSARGRAEAAADLAHAPGKKHRKASPTVHGAKHSDSRIPKAKASAAARQRRKSYA